MCPKPVDKKVLVDVTIQPSHAKSSPEKGLILGDRSRRRVVAFSQSRVLRGCVRCSVRFSKRRAGKAATVAVDGMAAVAFPNPKEARSQVGMTLKEAVDHFGDVVGFGIRCCCLKGVVDADGASAGGCRLSQA